jgi:uncharacterized membrane protein
MVHYGNPFVPPEVVVRKYSGSAFGLSPRAAAVVATFFLGIGGVVILLGNPREQWVRFLAVQSIALVVAYCIAEGVLMVLAAVPGARFAILPVVVIGEALLNVVLVVTWLAVTVRAFQGTAVRVPIIAEQSDRWAPPTSA